MSCTHSGNQINYSLQAFFCVCLVFSRIIWAELYWVEFGLIWTTCNDRSFHFLPCRHPFLFSLSCMCVLVKPWLEVLSAVYMAEESVFYKNSTWRNQVSLICYLDYRAPASRFHGILNISLLEKADCNSVNKVCVNTMTVIQEGKKRVLVASRL